MPFGCWRQSQTSARRWWLYLSTTSVLCLLLWAGLAPQPVPSWPRLQVITYNIEGGLADHRQVLELLTPHQPDLVMLQEVLHVGQVQWFAERLQLPHWRFAPYQSHRQGGIALLSRWPLGAGQVLTFRHGAQGKVALAAPVLSAAATLWACSVHLDAPRLREFNASVWQQGAFLWSEVFAATPRYQQVRELRAWLRQLSTDAWIIGGDFNSVPFSRADRYFSRDFGDALLQRPWRYLTGTYWELPHVLVNPRIDFLYHSPRVRVIEAQVLQHKISDHFPILAMFAVPGSPQEQSTPDYATTAAPAAVSHPPLRPLAHRGYAAEGISIPEW
jgi:endonuclease/exonuclease/phosphatase (EEP) superfamily protein YafD